MAKFKGDLSCPRAYCWWRVASENCQVPTYLTCHSAFSHKGQVADCWVGQPSIETSPNHFYVDLIEDLEYKQEHILDAALFVPTLPTFVLQMFAFARNNGAGPRCFLAQWLRLWGLCHMKSRAQMGSCGTSVVTDCQSSLLWTWSNTVNWCHPSTVIWRLHLSHVPWGFCQDYTVKEATVLSWLRKLLKWNQLVYFLNTSVTKRQSSEKSPVSKIFQLEGGRCLYMLRGALWFMVAVLSNFECLLGVCSF